MSAHSITLAPPLPASAPRAPRARAEGGHNTACGVARGTRIRTIFGLRRVEEVMAGDLLLDARGQILVLRAVQRRQLRGRALVRIAPSVLGLGGVPGQLDRALLVGAGQQLALRDWRTEVLFGKPALTRSANLVDGVHVTHHAGPRVVYDLRLDQHAVIEVDGVGALLPALDP